MGRDVDRVSPTKDPLATAVLMLFIGLIMIVLGAGALSVVVIFAGVMLLVYGSSSISRGVRSNSNSDLLIGIVMAVVGLLLVIATGRMTSILIILVALFLMALGVLAIVTNLEAGKRRRNTALGVGIVMIIVGVVLIAYPGATTETMMIVIGVVLVVVSLLSLYSYMR